jgi:hypothetical protein
MGAGRLVAAALGAGLLLGGCTAAGGDREPGAPVTPEEAQTLSRLLQRNSQRGGADFVATAPFGGDAVLTVTGEVDFRGAAGRAQVTTSPGGARPDRTAEVVFTADDVWLEDADALAAAGLPDARWLRRPLGPDGTAELLDVVLRVVLNLGREPADQPRSFLERDWTWEGRRSIDSRLSMLYGDPAGRTVAVDAQDDLLRQYVTPVPGESFELTVTLAEHGRRTVALPDAADAVTAADHPELADRFGL